MPYQQFLQKLPLLEELCDTWGSSIACKTQSKPRSWQSALRWASRKLPFWSQVLGAMHFVESLLDAEQRKDCDLLNARAEGMMCPALIELACETLETVGREPRRL